MSRALLAAICTGLAALAVARLLVRPAPRLAPRVHPYTVQHRIALGQSVEPLAWQRTGARTDASVVQLVRPMLTAAAAVLSRLVDRRSDELLALRLRQAGWYPSAPAEERVQAYRLRQLSRTVAGALLGSAAAAMAQGGSGHVLGLALLAGLGAAARGRGVLDRAVAERRLQMRIELYTVNQVLALHVRVGGGVVQALQRVAQRGSGVVAEEIAEILRVHLGGRRLPEALEAAARVTVDPFAARTYRLLAAGAAFGSDLTQGLRALNADLRDERLEALKRTATKRRAAMLVPIVAVLAPVMLLFVGAPLPSIVLGGLGR